MSQREHAHELLGRRGLHPFPLDHPGHPECIGLHGPNHPCDGQRGKHPTVKWGTWAIAVTHQQIDLQWAKHRGLHNIGVSCGPSGLVVLDEDAPGELDKWAVTYGVDLPDTYTVATGRTAGGRHLYYRWDHTGQKIGNVEKIFTGFKVNVRGDGGYVVAEFSQHQTGAVYTGNGLPIAPLPPEVAALLTAGNTRQDDNNIPAPARGTAVVETVTTNPNAARIGFGDRHKNLVTYAGRLRKAGLDYCEALPVFHQRWLLCEQPTGQIPEAKYHGTPPADCDYPVTWDEAQGKLLDVFDRYPAGQPAGTALTCLADVKPEPVEWLWPGYLPRGKIVTLDGDPGLGKSTLALALAAAVTTGAAWPDGTRCERPGNVLLLSAEDGLADTVRPRLDAAGADVTKVHAIDGVPITTEDGEQVLRPLTLADVDALAAAVTTTGAALIIVDVLMAHLPSGADSHKDQDIRRVLGRLSKLADSTGCAIVLIRHLNKAKGGDPIYRGGGSIGIVGAARAGLLVAADPSNPEVRVLASIKSNLGPAPKSLSYRLTGVESGVARVEWGGEVEHSAHDLLRGPDDEGDQDARTEAEHWLDDYLSAQGETRSDEIKRDAAKTMIAERTLKRAMKSLGVVVSCRGMPRRTYWSLPNGANGSTPAPGAQKLGPNGPTGADQQERVGPTGLNLQSGQPASDGPTGPLDSAEGTEGEPSQPSASCRPPGGVTAATPGQTDRVALALANATRKSDGADAYRQGFCCDCKAVPYSAGRTRCDACHAKRQIA